MSKRLKQNIYIAIITLLAFSLFIYTYTLDHEFSLYNLAFWSLLVIIAETFLIISPSSGAATSVAPAIFIYIIFVANPFTVMIITIVGLTFRFPEYDGERKHIMNAKKSTTFFNLANLMLTVGSCALVMDWFMSIGKISSNYIYMTLISVIGLLLAELMNFVLVAILIRITQGVQPVHIFRSMVKTFPSTIAIGSLGIFLAYIHNQHDMEIILIFFIPLLLARYSFKLYFESQRMALDTIHALNEALHAKDAYTGGHTGRVEKYAVELAAAYGLSHADCEVIRTAALLHDIGKIGIPDHVLNKPGRLSQDEFAQIQEHSSIGAKILGNVNSLKRVANIIVQHHERYDGSGYPNRLRTDEITIEAAILMISDSYDAMTTDRPYRKALTKEESIRELEKYAGTQFHPILARTFIDDVLLKDQSESLADVDEGQILEKTKDLIESNSDLPQDPMEPDDIHKSKIEEELIRAQEKQESTIHNKEHDLLAYKSE